MQHSYNNQFAENAEMMLFFLERRLRAFYAVRGKREGERRWEVLRNLRIEGGEVGREF